MLSCCRVLLLTIAMHGHGDDTSSNWQATVDLDVDLTDDVGESWGSVIEATDAEGAVVAGAGFMDAYNTQDRSDRRVLHVYVRVPADDSFPLERLPNPSTDAGTYLFADRGNLFAKGRASVRDPLVRRWDGDRNEWVVDEKTVPFAVEVGKEVIALSGNQILHGPQAILTLPAEDGRLAEPYVGAGLLVCRRLGDSSSSSANELWGTRWKPRSAPIDQASVVRQPLVASREFVYCYGTHAGEVLAMTNMGGVHAFDGNTWRTIRPADPNVSFQVYSSLRFGSKLLLGQYPTGELFEWAGGDLVSRPGSPPVMLGVHRAAREAQTMAVYGGRLYVGVWPWGEVWRSDDTDHWQFMGRVFTHPEPTDVTVHPYETQTKALDPVLNRWGQRVTSMVPWGDSLYISTSAKTSAPYEEKFDFMTRRQAEEYGAVYRHHLPGSLAVPIDRSGDVARIRIRWRDGELRIDQDGKNLGLTRWKKLGLHPPTDVTANRGIFGEGRRASRVDLKVETEATKPTFMSAYIDLSRVVDFKADVATRQKQIDGMLDRFKETGLAIVMPYANTSSGKTYFPSRVATRHVDKEWDALGAFVRSARERELAVWPVVCVMASGHFEPKGVLEDHPEWALRQTDGKPWGFLSPAHPEARSWVIKLLGEIADRYQPDGILLDYLRYFNRPYLLDPSAEEELAQRTSHLTDEKLIAAETQRTREAHLSSLAEAISRRLRQARPDIQIGIYTWGPHVAKDHLVAQAWPTWVDRGWIDLVNVSGYYYASKYGDKALSLYEDRLREARTLAGGDDRQVPVTVAIGVETSHGKLTSAAEIDDYLRRARQAGMDGVGVFTWHTLEPYREELAERGSLNIFSQPR